MKHEISLTAFFFSRSLSTAVSHHKVDIGNRDMVCVEILLPFSCSLVVLVRANVYKVRKTDVMYNEAIIKKYRFAESLNSVMKIQ